MKYKFCTICDKLYLPKLLVLIDTLKNQKIYILCLDDYTYEYLNNQKFEKKIFLYNKKIIETHYLLKDKNKNPYYAFLIKVIFIHYIFDKILKRNNFIIYLDSDICFFSPIKNLINYLDKKYSIFLTPHNFNKKLVSNIKYGKFNAGFIAFKKDFYSEKALIWWMKSCIQNCTIDLDRSLVGDQYYLNTFPKKFKKVHILKNLGINCGPWNVENKKLYIKKNKFYLGESDLVFFHFQGLRRIVYNFYYTNFSAYKIAPIPGLIKLYKSYVNKIDKKRKILPNSSHKINFKIIVKALAYNDYIVAK
jgi:hypothetical protein